MERHDQSHDEPVANAAGADPAPAAAAPGDAEVAAGALREAVDRATKAATERDEYLDRLRRTAADFENYRKRQTRDREQLLAQANERLVKELLPVLDDLERAVEAFAEHDAKRIRDGVEMVHRGLRALLEREGISEISPEGIPFDPHEHEALTTQSVTGAEEGTVLQVVQRGFKLGERVIRPARVVVAAAPPDSAGG
jgi:molecular chaperone GrpE